MSDKSSVILLMDLVWSNANSSTGFSYERLNHAMRFTLNLAIGSGFVFAEDDIETVIKNYRSFHWIGEDDEWLYSSAIANGNTSAVKSYEKYKPRSPIIADRVTPARCGHGGYLHGDPSERKRERLAVGSEFYYQGLRLKVNSFAKDSSYANCGLYEWVDGKDGHSTKKLKKRFKITAADIKADRKLLKQREGLE